MMATVSTETRMSASDRLATVAYLKDLQQEFAQNTVCLFAARAADDMPAYWGISDRSASLYREITEVEVALGVGVLPF